MRSLRTSENDYKAGAKNMTSVSTNISASPKLVERVTEQDPPKATIDYVDYVEGSGIES